MRKILLIGIFSFTGSLFSFAHDFVVTSQGQSLYYNITNRAHSTVEVTYKGSIAEHSVSSINGEVTIPEKVRYKNKIYKVVSIGEKAFSGASNLTGIILPSSISEIKSFAFENCKRLKKIVFPGGNVSFGQGTFFKCSSIQNVSFGSDWKKINFRMFRWSDSLQTVTIPAKVEKIYNLKDLKYLNYIEVDENNMRFSSFNGVLYNKTGKLLYGVPRNFQGILKIKSGTQSIQKGALIDCPNIEKLILPESLTYISFRETSRMQQLKEVVFKNEVPIKTAYTEGQGFFLLQVASPDVLIVVPKNSKKEYMNNLVLKPGAFSESIEDSNLLYDVSENELPRKKNIKGIKNFSSYE